MLNTLLTTINTYAILATDITADNFGALSRLTTLLTVIAEVIGVPYLAWGFYNLARSYKKRDQGGMDNAIDDLIVASLFIIAGVVIAFLKG